jgi:uncharacterized membrane protein
MSGRAPIIVLAAAATAGLFFSSFSTFDFVQHLDRQVHDIHCSFVPGLVEADEGAEGCQLTMMSPYSSQMRSLIWGGIPISLASMSVFAFLLFRTIDLLGRAKEEIPSSTNFLLATTLIPVAASGVMGYIAYNELHAACKLCIGIYASSTVAFLAAIAVRRSLLKAFVGSGAGRAPGAKNWIFGAGQLGAFVAVPVLGYIILAPDNSEYIGKCGALVEPDDPYDVMVSMDDRGSGVPTIEVFDPLCPACRAFEERLSASSLEPKLQRNAVLFPLDAECNWMVGSSLHPGACAVSEAVLCAADGGAVEPAAVIDWAFANQEEILAAAKADPTAAASMVKTEFSAIADCVGSAEARQKLNKSLRWTVANQLPVLTPQLYVDGVKLCDEDTDLGLDWALRRMLRAHDKGELKKLAGVPDTPPAEEAPAKPAKRKVKSKAAAPEPAPKPAAEKPAEEKPSAEKPAEEQPAAEEKPAEEKPAAEEKRAEKKPDPEPPAEEAPAEGGAP